MNRSTSRGHAPGTRGRPASSSSSLTSADAAVAHPIAEAIGPADDIFEREADRAADAVLRGGSLRPAGAAWSAAAGAGDTIQRKCAGCEEEEEEKIRRAPRDDTPVPEVAAPGPAVDSDVATKPTPETPRAAPDADSPVASPQETDPSGIAAPSLLVDDESDPHRGQMRKSEFMAALRPEVCATVDEALSGTGRNSAGCPWIDHWMGYYEGRSSAQIERSLRRYAPEAATATAVTDYIAIVTARVRRSAEIWAATGEISGVPADVPQSPMPGGKAAESFGGMFFKARPGGPRRANPASIRSQLGGGQSLPGPVRHRMESAFGTSFAGVRLHADADAARLSDRLNARAFTIGSHVAFGGGEFRPGTVVGDVLIAHELAHVVQQGRAPALTNRPSNQARLENDADVSAAAAVAQPSTGLRAAAMPRLRSGLSLQRCSKPSPAIDLKALTPQQLDAFIKGRFEKKDQKAAREILNDILASDDDLRYADLEELSSEIRKRLLTSRLMQKTQDLYGTAFEYPNHKRAKECVGGRDNPRVNKAAENYWGPVQDAGGHYFFDLSDAGKKNAYQALVTLFTPQKTICDMTLIHCDYLVSVVHFRTFAERLGADEFNRRVAAGDIRMRLQWNGFQGIEKDDAPGEKGISLKEARPQSEKDLVIGDHVIFWNHRAYDAINEVPRNAWRLENAILISKEKGNDIFLGHGSRKKTNNQMRQRLADEYNEVVRKAIKLIKVITKKDAKSSAARAEMTSTFPHIKEDGGRWKIETKRKKDFDVKEVKASDPDLTGLRDPNDPSKMYPVKRPIESD